MEHVLSMALSGAAHHYGGEWVISVGLRHHGDVVCTATKRFPLAVGANPSEPWQWAQQVLDGEVDLRLRVGEQVGDLGPSGGVDGAGVVGDSAERARLV